MGVLAHPRRRDGGIFRYGRGGQTDALGCLQARQNRVALSPLSAEATDLRRARSYRAGDVSLPPRRVPARLGGAMSPPPRSFSGCRTPSRPVRSKTCRAALPLTVFIHNGLGLPAAGRDARFAGGTCPPHCIPCLFRCILTGPRVTTRKGGWTCSKRHHRYHARDGKDCQRQGLAIGTAQRSGSAALRSAAEQRRLQPGVRPLFAAEASGRSDLQAHSARKGPGNESCEACLTNSTHIPHPLHLR